MSEADRKDMPEQAEFRQHCRDWLENNHPGRPPVRLPQGALELSDPDALAWLQDWQKSAYDAGLMVNYHGCTIPRGWEVRYPNIMTMEAVRGAEQYSFAEGYPETRSNCQRAAATLRDNATSLRTPAMVLQQFR